MKIPEKFTSAGTNPVIAKTVGQLRKLLAELPDQLQVRTGFDEVVELAVYEEGTSEVHLLIDCADSDE